MRVAEFVRFIEEREYARIVKEEAIVLGPKQRKLDPIIAQYRFCNVRREDDAVTKWIDENIRLRFGAHEHGWFPLIVARLFNLPESLSLITQMLLPFDEKGIRKTLTAHKGFGGKVFNAAYIVSTNGRPGDKLDYVLRSVLRPIWQKRAAITASFKGATLAEIHELLQAQNGLGSFMAAQVVADLKYTPAYRAAEDWHTFAASGPGSRRGLNRVMDYPTDKPWRESPWRVCLADLRDQVLKRVKATLRDLHAQDIQNCLCEFDKYERARLGEGTPKQKYPRKEKK